MSLCEEDKLGWSMCVSVCGGDWMNTEKRERKLRVDHLYTAVYHIALNFRGSKLFLRIVSSPFYSTPSAEANNCISLY